MTTPCRPTSYFLSGVPPYRELWRLAQRTVRDGSWRDSCQAPSSAPASPSCDVTLSLATHPTSRRRLISLNMRSRRDAHRTPGLHGEPSRRLGLRSIVQVAQIRWGIAVWSGWWRRIDDQGRTWYGASVGTKLGGIAARGPALAGPHRFSLRLSHGHHGGSTWRPSTASRARWMPTPSDPCRQYGLGERGLADELLPVPPAQRRPAV